MTNAALEHDHATDNATNGNSNAGPVPPIQSPRPTAPKNASGCHEQAEQQSRHTKQDQNNWGNQSRQAPNHWAVTPSAGIKVQVKQI